MRRLVASGLALLLLLAAVPTAGAVEPEIPEPRPLERRGDDQGRPLVPPDGGGMSAQAADPLGLLPLVDILRTHSLGTDVIDVWDCHSDEHSLTEIVAELDATVVPWFAAHSRGRLMVDFVARGSEPAETCDDEAFANASANANGVLLVASGQGGFAGPGYYGWTSFPQNQRYAVVGIDWVFPMVTAHELGHTQAWPHVDSQDQDLYDNPLDVMSGNQAENGVETELPFGTAAINRYAAGWIDPGQVRILTGQAATFRLEPSSGSGLQMAVIQDGATYYTLGARTTSTYDPIPTAWQGVEVNEVIPCPVNDLESCVNGYGGTYGMGFRQVAPYGRVHWVGGDGVPAHLIRPGTSKTVLDRTVTVTAASGGRYDVTVSAGTGPLFVDTGSSSFEDDIEWLATEGITRGCNPPTNDRFCPDAPVTRGQMAAFLHRALPDLPTGTPLSFTDTGSSTFRLDIEWLSATGVTRGCNPPTNDRFCPDNAVTRGQMAAFLHRALPDLPTGTPLSFTDTGSSTFRLDIEWLSATGVTRGCNPPTNDRFCPDNPVTRGQMAAFLRRALED
jgi:hypothetical protein